MRGDASFPSWGLTLGAALLLCVASGEAGAAAEPASPPSPQAPAATPSAPAPAPGKAEDKAKAAPASKPPPALPENLETIPTDKVISILGKKVWGRAGEDMGLVTDVLVDDDGIPRAAVIDFGGFLGVGSRKVAVDWRLLHFAPSGSKTPILLHLDRAEIQGAPEYKPSSGKTAEIVGPPPLTVRPATKSAK